MIARLALVTLAIAGTLAACGRIGNPVPPDDYGIGMRIQAEQKKEREQASKEQAAREAAAKAQQQKLAEEPAAPPDEITLPDMRPVETRQP